MRPFHSHAICAIGFVSLLAAEASNLQDLASNASCENDGLHLIQHLAQEVARPGRRMQQHLRHCISQYADGLDAIRPGLGANIRGHPLRVAATSDRPIIIGAAPGTSGTKTLRAGLLKLGIRASHHGLNGQLQKHIVSTLLGRYDWPRGNSSEHVWAPSSLDEHTGFSKQEGDACLQEVRSFNYSMIEDEAINDDPVAMLFLELFLSFPNAKFIFSYRPEVEWAERRRSEFPHRDLLPMLEPCGLLHMDTEPHFTIEETARLYSLLHGMVECSVPSDRLLTFNLWRDPEERSAHILAEIAEFLGKPVPESQGLPHLTGHGDTMVDLAAPDGRVDIPLPPKVE